MIKVFVYGTLKPGEVNYAAYCHRGAIAAKPAFVRGWLYDLPLGYPAMILGEGRVWGTLLELEGDRILARLDTLEDFDAMRSPLENEYQRCEVEVYHPSGESLGRAWVYTMNPDKIQSLQGIFLPSGSWTSGNCGNE